MSDRNILAPLFRTIDRVFFGIEESQDEPEMKDNFIEIDTEEEFDVKRSIN